MRRGEIWTLQDKHYASKARPVVVIQSDKHNSFNSIILCLFTSFESGGISTRVRIQPSAENGLQKESYVMTDKIVTVDKIMLGKRVGVLSDEDMVAVSEQLRIILEL
ncbi:MAG: type II toxin-antitoxin system PemK/MazF family toxin [Lachnospiraceae bacterium]|nr:type II toxin-antitoxin system PemK/MazF family toxin [Lachnospiraceae bacterium]